MEAAGVEYSPAGVKVKDDLRTSNPDILAIGDVAWGKEEDEKTPTKWVCQGFVWQKQGKKLLLLLLLSVVVGGDDSSGGVVVVVSRYCWLNFDSYFNAGFDVFPMGSLFHSDPFGIMSL